MFRSSGFTLAFTALLTAFLVAGASAPAFSQTPTKIDTINTDLGSWGGVFVSVDGWLIADGDGVWLWTDWQVASRTTNASWAQRLVLVDGGGLPVDPTIYNYWSATVEGIVNIAFDPNAPGGGQFIGEISVSSFATGAPAPFTPPTPGVAPPTKPPVEPDFGRAAAPCDSCHFVFIICGLDQADYWNDIVGKYQLKADSMNVCKENIVILYGQSGSRDPSIVPDGTTSGGSFTSGGIFNSSNANVDSALAYFKKRIMEEGCAHPVFQFHSTGHGSGYQTHAGQDRGLKNIKSGDPVIGGFAGGVVDADGDEIRKFHENDIKFQYSLAGLYDRDNNGIADLRISSIVNPHAPPPRIILVELDQNEDGMYEVQVGTDDNEDGCVTNADTSWHAPDMNRSGGVDSVAFDEVLELGNNERLLDDEFNHFLDSLQTCTNLTADSTRVEMAQCFSGGFIRDIDGTTTESTSATNDGEFSYSKRGAGGGNAYELPFIAALGKGKNWEDAHKEAVDSVGTSGYLETPQYDRNFGPPSTNVNDMLRSSALQHNFPNPFNPATTIPFTLVASGHVELAIFDVRGTRVRTLIDGLRSAGAHREGWDGRDDAGRRVASGVYFYRLVADGAVMAHKMVLLK